MKSDALLQKKARKPGDGFRARDNRCEVGKVVQSGDEGTFDSDLGVFGGNALSNYTLCCEVSNAEKQKTERTGQCQANTHLKH